MLFSVSNIVYEKKNLIFHKELESVDISFKEEHNTKMIIKNNIYIINSDKSTFLESLKEQRK